MFSPNKSRQRNWKADSELLDRIYIYCGQRLLWEPFTFLSCLCTWQNLLSACWYLKVYSSCMPVWHQCLAIQWHQFNYSRNFITSLAHNISKIDIFLHTPHVLHVSSVAYEKTHYLLHLARPVDTFTVCAGFCECTLIKALNICTVFQKVA